MGGYVNGCKRVNGEWVGVGGGVKGECVSW